MGQGSQLKAKWIKQNVRPLSENPWIGRFQEWNHPFLEYHMIRSLSKIGWPTTVEGLPQGTPPQTQPLWRFRWMMLGDSVIPWKKLDSSEAQVLHWFSWTQGVTRGTIPSFPVFVFHYQSVDVPWCTHYSCQANIHWNTTSKGPWILTCSECSDWQPVYRIILSSFGYGIWFRVPFQRAAQYGKDGILRNQRWICLAGDVVSSDGYSPFPMATKLSFPVKVTFTQSSMWYRIKIATAMLHLWYNPAINIYQLLLSSTSVDVICIKSTWQETISPICPTYYQTITLQQINIDIWKTHHLYLLVFLGKPCLFSRNLLVCLLESKYPSWSFLL